MLLYGVYYWLFKTFCWRWKWLSTVNIISTPILEGSWVGKAQTSYVQDAPVQDAPVHDVEVIIGQDWTDMLIRLRGPNSTSRSLSGSMLISEDETGSHL